MVSLNEVKKAQKEIQPPSTTMPFTSFGDWKKKFAAQEGITINSVFIILPETITSIIWLIGMILIIGSVIYAIYVDRRKLKAVKQLEKHAEFIKEVLRGGTPER